MCCEMMVSTENKFHKRVKQVTCNLFLTQEKVLDLGCVGCDAVKNEERLLIQTRLSHARDGRRKTLDDF